jgi:hypothetical protein
VPDLVPKPLPEIRDVRNIECAVVQQDQSLQSRGVETGSVGEIARHFDEHQFRERVWSEFSLQCGHDRCDAAQPAICAGTVLEEKCGEGRRAVVAVNVERAGCESQIRRMGDLVLDHALARIAARSDAVARGQRVMRRRHMQPDESRPSVVAARNERIPVRTIG